MTSLDKLKDAFASCRGPFPFRDFVRLLGQLGYEEVKAGRTGGSRRKFLNRIVDDVLYLHEPHPGTDMGAGMVKRLQQHLKDRKLL
ncbi:type II toxin-antitoxin system HicA family toxin [Ferrovibrio sp.]|uniref:type II toxin-antitoxin system HicA family toxin n=1 Tax=Ferrovibrio sp. TaxID=1917215 RepID=UPI00352FEF31